MAASRWKQAYHLIQGQDDTEPDIEANTAGSYRNKQQQNGGEDDHDSAAVENVPLQTLNGAQPTVASTNKPSSEGSNGNDNDDDDDSGKGSSVQRVVNTDAGSGASSGSVSNGLGARNGPNTVTESNRQLLDCVNRGDHDGCIELLRQTNIGLDVNFKGSKEMTALHLAAKKGHEGILQLLLNQGASKYIKDGEAHLPIHYAAHNGYLECIKILLDGCPRNDVQLNGKKRGGRTALMEAVVSGCHGCCSFLIGLDVDETDDAGNTALHHAVTGNYIMIVDFLLQKGAKATHRNASGVMPLYEAAAKKTKDYLVKLLQYTQRIPDDAFVGDKRGKNIIHYAVTQRVTECLKHLLEIQVVRENIDKWEDGEGNAGTPLHYAVYCRTFPCISILLKAGASHAIKCNGVYPIHMAAEKGFNDVCKEMLAIDKSLLTMTDDLGHIPLHMAVKSGSIETVDLFCSKLTNVQLSPSVANKEGKTALHMAVKKGDENIINRLISGNIALGKQDSRGFTGLHLAAAMGNLIVCENLVKKGRSNLYKCNESGVYPLDLAFQSMSKNSDTVIYLLKESFEKPPKKSLKDNSTYLTNLMVLRCRMRKYMEKALDKSQRNVVEAIINTRFWEDAFIVDKTLKPENFKKLIPVFPDLALKVQGKYIRSETAENGTYGFALYENSYYMRDEGSPFDEAGKLKPNAKDHRSDVYTWVAEHPVTHIINNSETQLLKHPVTQAWLRHKWTSYVKYIHFFLLFLEGIYLFALICLMATSWNWIHIHKAFNTTKEQFCEASKQLYQGTEINMESSLQDNNATKTVKDFENAVGHYKGFYAWLFVTWIIKVILELFYLGRLKRYYIRKDMIPQLVIEGSQLFLTMVLLFAPFAMCHTQSLGLLQEDEVWQCGVIAVLLAWLHLVNSLNQALASEFLPIAKDFLEILVKVAYFLVTFICIFAFIFHLLLLDQDPFGSFFQSIGSTLVWMLLDLGYTDTFVEKKLSYPILSNMIFFLFITTIGCLIVSLISRERSMKAKGKELGNDYKRLAIYAKLLFRYDICFPHLRRRFAVSEYVDDRKNQTLLENYLGSIENEETADDTVDSKDIVKRIDKLEVKINDIGEQVSNIWLLLSKNRAFKKNVSMDFSEH